MTHRTFHAKAPAKLNIRLKITGRREDGYHQLVSLMVPISLYDILELRSEKEGIEFRCSGLSLPPNGENLVVRAAKAFFTRTGVQGGVSITLEKKIPVAAGLGGGSSDAAATLLSLNKMWSSPIAMHDLHQLARELGADVPFFLYGKPALTTGIGDIVEPLLERWPAFWYVVVHPRILISTSWIYQQYQLKKLTIDEYIYIKKLLSEEPIAISRILENDLETVTSAKFPIIESIKKVLIKTGAEGALMTGSGSSVFGVYSSYEGAKFGEKEIVSKCLGDVFVLNQWESG